ncbi:MAG: DUF5672 family protein [Odoribacter sp.]
MDESVKIIIPVYKPELGLTEYISLSRCQKVLGRYTIVLVKPRSLDISGILELCGNNFEIEEFDDCFFDGVAGYNRLMLNTGFYERFSDVEYILIYQLDAYVFRDELETWCKKGYDYIGAPWLRKEKYHRWYYALYWGIKRDLYHIFGIRSFHDTFDRVGNGGFSLRKVDSHIKITQEMPNEIGEYIRKNSNKRFNEDSFWAIEVPPKYSNFKIPEWREALKFAFDVQVKECFHYNGNNLPFGIHGWNIRLQYYQDYIEEL